jgi:release factor glutamine methyltransferase
VDNSSENTMKIGELLRAGGDQLQLAGREDARRDAHTLLVHLLDRDLAWVVAHPEAEVGQVLQDRFRDWIGQRATGRPIAHLTGRREFYGRDFEVDRTVLIPRPETELVVEEALKALARSRPSAAGLSAADIGTGSGCIAVTLAAENQAVAALATDVSQSALTIAASNAQRHGVANRIRFQKADLLPENERGFDLIVSNPPYVAIGEPELDPEVAQHEPPLALFAGPDGLGFYRRLVPLAEERLAPGGWLVLELGHKAEPGVRGLLDAQRWGEIRVLPDLAGIPRCLIARLAKE